MHQQTVLKAILLGVAGLLALLFVTAAYAGDDDWEAADCSTVPVRITHPEFSPDGFTCLKAREAFGPGLDERAIWQLSGGYFIYANWSRELGDGAFAMVSDGQLKDDLKVANTWARNFSYDWTSSEEHNDGKTMSFLVNEDSGAERRCFGHISYSGQTFAGFKERKVVIYCALGRTHFSSADIQGVLDQVIFEQG